MKKLSLIVPCYNEELNVKAFHKEALKSLELIDFELEFIFINDGSKDNTINELYDLASSSQSRVKIIDFSRNFGKEAAMYAGLKESTGDYSVVIDADLQQPPALVVPMLEFLEKNSDFDSVAYYQVARKEALLLRIFKRLFYKIINKISEVEFKPGASDFRLFSRNMVDAILSLSEKNRFSKGIFSWVGFNTKFMPYQANERHMGVSSWSFFKLFNYAVKGITSFSAAPLKLATILGVLFSFGSFAYFALVIVQKIFFGIDLPGYPSIIGLIALLGGVQLFVLGIIGEYLSNIYSEAKNRPIYIARTIYDNKNIDNKVIKWYTI